jgi:hypothetical protein
MSACDPITIPFTGSINDFIEKAKGKIAPLGGNLVGDGTAGNFDANSPVGKVAGTYTVSGQTFTITITEKPLMLGCGMIENLLKSALS